MTGRARAPASVAAGVPRLRESSQRTRETMLEASTAKSAEKSYDGARMDEMALRSGIQKNVLYWSNRASAR